MAGRTYRVKEVAELAGVSVRALHHYDEIGLLTPRGRTRASYRLYDDADLLRLQQILIGRELGLSLEHIRSSLDDPSFDRRTALLQQRKELEARKARASLMVAAIDAALAVLDDSNTKGNPTMNPASMFEGFVEETESRWGTTDAFKESQKRTKDYTPEDWQRLNAEQAAIYVDAAKLQAAGASPESDEACAVAERHRESIARWFYPCSATMHAKLADMYEADSRFAANIDKHGANLTPFLSATIRANAQR